MTSFWVPRVHSWHKSILFILASIPTIQGMIWVDKGLTRILWEWGKTPVIDWRVGVWVGTVAFITPILIYGYQHYLFTPKRPHHKWLLSTNSLKWGVWGWFVGVCILGVNIGAVSIVFYVLTRVSQSPHYVNHYVMNPIMEFGYTGMGQRFLLVCWSIIATYLHHWRVMLTQWWSTVSKKAHC